MDILGGLIGGGLGAIGSITGGIISGNAAKEGAEIAAQEQEKTNAMTIDLANTAVQRRAKDMEAAGFNKLLAVGSPAETPTLHAATQRGEGVAAQGEITGNMMANLGSTILQFMTGQQQIELAKANADKATAEANKTIAETPYVAPTAEQHIAESQAHTAEATSASLESRARTATIDAMRAPEVANIVASAARQAQETKTEEQRTREQIAAADNANTLFGAKASEAATIAAQAASYYKNFFTPQEQQKIDEKDIQIQLLKDDDFGKVISNILANDYGRQLEWSKIFSGLTQTGSQIGGPKGKVIPGK